jgi:hypothetical protein
LTISLVSPGWRDDAEVGIAAGLPISKRRR